MPFRRAAAVAVAVSALAPAVLLAAAGPARADAPVDPGTLPSCEEVATPPLEYDQDTLRTTVSGVPGTVRAGDGWHEFSASIANLGDTTVPLVTVEASAWRETDGGTELGPYARVEVRTAAGDWQPLKDGSSGHAAPIENLAAHSSAAYAFRLRITPDAPADVTFGEVSVEAIFADAYQAQGSTTTVDCAGDSVGDQGFRITPAGSTATPTPSATPTPTPTATHSAAPSGPATAGGASDGTSAGTSAGATPGAGAQLAATGAPDALPLLAGLGAAALAAGAGAVAAGRRRAR